MDDTTSMASGDPASYQKIVGATFAKAEHKALIVIGKRSWSKLDLGRILCPHPMAARRVQMAIQQLEIKTPAQFIDRAHEFGRLKSLGVTAYWTVLAICRDLGADIEEVHGEDVSFNSIHSRALKQEAGVSVRRRRKRTL
jgi:hypothetical protein